MEDRTISISLEKAREWYNSDNVGLREIALQAFSDSELRYGFSGIKTIKDACDRLNYDYGNVVLMADRIKELSKASAAMFEANIVRKALECDNGHSDSTIYYPYNPIITEQSVCDNSDVNSGNMSVIGNVRYNGDTLYVLGGRANIGGGVGMTEFDEINGICFCDANVALFGCRGKEVAEHFGKYFGMLITEAKYGDLYEFDIIK